MRDYIHSFGCKSKDLMFAKLEDNLFKFYYGDNYFICFKDDKGWMRKQEANVDIENDRLLIKRRFKLELTNLLLDDVDLIEISKDELDFGFETNLINRWEHGFCLEVKEIEKPSKKQSNRFNIIVGAIQSPNEDRVSENKASEAIASRIEIDIDSVDAEAFREGYVDAKIYSTWFRKCEKCNKIKNKDSEYRTEWRKNRKRRGGGQTTYSSRCNACEHESGVKWGNN